MSAGICAHAGPMHLVGNLLLLAVCWPAVAGALGPCRAGALLAVAGCAANGAAAILIGHAVIGASGGASAALAAVLVLRPRGRVGGHPLIPAALAWLAINFLLGTLGDTFAGIAWPAHLIGAALGTLGACVLRSSPPRLKTGRRAVAGKRSARHRNTRDRTAWHWPRPCCSRERGKSRAVTPHRCNLR